MHNAPPVAFPVGRFAWGRAVWLAMVLLSALGLLWWSRQSQVEGAVVLLACIFWALCAWAAWVWAPRQNLNTGRLFWSGEAWFWQADTESGGVSTDEQSIHLSVGWDLGAELLLWVTRLDHQGRCDGLLTCAWVSEATMPSKWHGFRCAVYSRPKIVRAA